MSEPTTESATPRHPSTHERVTRAVAHERKVAHREKLRRANHTHAQTDTPNPTGDAERNHRPSDRSSVFTPVFGVSLGLPTPSTDPRCVNRIEAQNPS